MIDFRYHLVSIIAVFLALAVGLVVGSTALSPIVEKTLQKTETQLRKNYDAVRAKNGSLNQQVSADQAFAQAGAHRLLSGLLTGEKVVLVVAPGADNAVTTGVTAALQLAGATVTGQVDLQQAFLTTNGQTEANLNQLSQNLASNAGLALPAASANAQQEAAQVIAASLLTTTSGIGLPDKARAAILAGFGQGGYLSVDATPKTATLAVLVAPGGSAPQTGGQVLVVTALELKAASSGIVMAGGVASIGPNSVISTENNAGQVSTVDNADTEGGQIMVVQELARLLAGKAPLPYGVGPVAAPSPAPTPTATPTPGTSATAGRHS